MLSQRSEPRARNTRPNDGGSAGETRKVRHVFARATSSQRSTQVRRGAAASPASHDDVPLRNRRLEDHPPARRHDGRSATSNGLSVRRHIANLHQPAVAGARRALSSARFHSAAATRVPFADLRAGRTGGTRPERRARTFAPNDAGTALTGPPDRHLRGCQTVVARDVRASATRIGTVDLGSANGRSGVGRVGRAVHDL